MHMSLALAGLLLAVGAVNCGGESDFEAVVLNSNLFGGSRSDIAEGSPYWWMSKGSPFKRAVAAGPPSQQFDFASNPFLRSGSANPAKLYSAPGYLPPDQPQPQPQPQPTRPPTVPCAGNGRACVPKFQCSNGFIDASQFRGSSSQASSCLQPEVCCRVQDEPRPTPTVNVITYQPSPSTQRPYVTPAVQTPRPVITKKPFVGQQYIPPRDNEVPQGTNPVGQYLPPLTGEDEKSEPIPNNSNDSPSSVQPPNQGNDELAQPLPPIQCPAATNCTEIQFCNADGSISKSPVILSPEQEQFRVPLSECRDIQRGFIGKCCRDPDYTDPWPTNLLRTGAFDANVLAQAFDDGQYRAPNGNNGNNGRKRGEEQKSPNIFIPQQSQTTISYTNAPFNPNAIPSNNKPSVPQPSTLQSSNPFNKLSQAPLSSPSPFINPQQQPIQNFSPLSPQSPTTPSFAQQPFNPQVPQRQVTFVQPAYTSTYATFSPAPTIATPGSTPAFGNQFSVQPTFATPNSAYSAQPTTLFPAQQPIGSFPSPQSPIRSFSAQPSAGPLPAQPSAGSFPAQPSAGSFLAPQPTASFPAQPSAGSFPAPQPTASFPAPQPTASFPAPQSPIRSFPAQPSAGSFPAQPSVGSFPAPQAAGSFPTQPSAGSFRAQSPTPGQFNPSGQTFSPQQNTPSRQAPFGQVPAQRIAPAQPSVSIPSTPFQNPFRSNQLGVCAVRDT